jgi:hypothetical protein
MKNRWLLNLLLAVVVAGLGLFVALKNDDQKQKPPLTSLKMTDIRSVRLVRADGSETYLTQCDNAWRLQTPVRARAHAFAVENLIRLSTAPVDADVSADARSLADYGLDKPAVRVFLNDEELAVGGRHPFKNLHYVLAQNRVRLVAANAVAPTLRRATDFIDTKLLAENQKLTGIEMSRFKLLRKDGTWQRAPKDEKASSDAINLFVSHWQFASALSVKRHEGGAAIGTIKLTMDDNGKPATLTLKIIKHESEFVLLRPDENLEYHFPVDVGKRLTALTEN